MLEDRAARAGSERTLTGWLRHNFAARERRNEQEDRIWHRVALVNDNGDEKKKSGATTFQIHTQDRVPWCGGQSHSQTRYEALRFFF